MRSFIMATSVASNACANGATGELCVDASTRSAGESMMGRSSSSGAVMTYWMMGVLERCTDTQNVTQVSRTCACDSVTVPGTAVVLLLGLWLTLAHHGQRSTNPHRGSTIILIKRAPGACIHRQGRGKSKPKLTTSKVRATKH